MREFAISSDAYQVVDSCGFLKPDALFLIRLQEHRIGEWRLHDAAAQIVGGDFRIQFRQLLQAKRGKLLIGHAPMLIVDFTADIAGDDRFAGGREPRHRLRRLGKPEEGILAFWHPQHGIRKNASSLEAQIHENHRTKAERFERLEAIRARHELRQERARRRAHDRRDRVLDTLCAYSHDAAIFDKDLFHRRSQTHRILNRFRELVAHARHAAFGIHMPNLRILSDRAAIPTRHRQTLQS